MSKIELTPLSSPSALVDGQQVMTGAGKIYVKTPTGIVEILHDELSVASVPGYDSTRPHSVTVTGVDNENGTGTFTVQVKNAAGVDLIGFALIEFWTVSTEDFTAPEALGTITFTNGEEIQEIVANAHYKIATALGGLATIEINAGNPDDVYLIVSLGGVLNYGLASITGGA